MQPLTCAFLSFLLMRTKSQGGSKSQINYHSSCIGLSTPQLNFYTPTLGYPPAIITSLSHSYRYKICGIITCKIDNFVACFFALFVKKSYSWYMVYDFAVKRNHKRDCLFESKWPRSWLYMLHPRLKFYFTARPTYPAFRGFFHPCQLGQFQKCPTPSS